MGSQLNSLKHKKKILVVSIWNLKQYRGENTEKLNGKDHNHTIHAIDKGELILHWNYVVTADYD